MDSTINGKTVHINNPLDLIGLGRREIEFNIHKADYWEMFKETTQVPTMKRGGYKNLLKGGWVFVDPFNQGRDLWTKDYFTKAGPNAPCWTDFGSSGDIFDYGTYGSGYYGIYDKKVVELCGYKVDYFCDSYEHGHKVDGIEVILSLIHI